MKWLRAVSIAVMLLVTGCDPVVRSKDGATRVVSKDIHCHKTSYCFTCWPGFDGKMKCGPKLSAFCPGKRVANVRITEVTSVLKSGRTRLWKRQEVIETIGGCR